MYYSQHRQDEYLDNFIFDPDKGPGYFVDVGAYDGVTFSNSYFLEKNRKWTGICIEPLPKQFKKLRSNRECCVEGVVSNMDTDTVEFCELDGYCVMLSGIVDKYSDEHKARIFNEQRDLGEDHLRNKIAVTNHRFNDLIKHTEIDLLDIDTEGGEIDILNDIDMGKYTINAIIVEDDSNSSELKVHMTKHGFDHVAYLGSDSLFVHERHMSNVKDDRPAGVSHTGQFFDTRK